MLDCERTKRNLKNSAFPTIMTLLVCLSIHLKPPGGKALVLSTGSDAKKVFNFSECLQDDNSVLSIWWCVSTWKWLFSWTGISLLHPPPLPSSPLPHPFSTHARQGGRDWNQICQNYLTCFHFFDQALCEHPIKLSATMLRSQMMLSGGPHLLPETTPAPKDSQATSHPFYICEGRLGKAKLVVPEAWIFPF